MVGEIRPDAGQLVLQADAVPPQFLARANAGQHQELRRAEHAGRHDHLASSIDLPRARVAGNQHAGGAAPDEQHSLHANAGQDGQIRARAGRIQKCDGRAAATPMTLRHLVEPRPFLARAVEIRVRAQAAADGGFDEGQRSVDRTRQIRD